MATMVHATESVDQPTWEIQKDAFAPPPTRRIIRGWDRAPVSARAPRLHGQKVWKKAGLKATSVEDTRDKGQEELEKEGAGARKKLRMLTARENINDAMWADAVPDVCSKDIEKILDNSGQQTENLNTQAASATDSSNGEIEIPLHSGSDGLNVEAHDPVVAMLQFIPRKRTNTDHVITPKKSLRQTTLDHTDRAPAINENSNSLAAKSKRSRKSLRKSMAASISGSTSEPKTSESQNGLTSSADRPSNIGSVTCCDKQQAAPVRESIIKRRSLRRSTITSRRSIAHAEQASEIGHAISQTIELDQQDAEIVSLPANSTTFGEDITPTGPQELIVTSDKNTCDTISTDLTLVSEDASESERTTCDLTPRRDSQGVDVVEVTVPEITGNIEEDIEQTEVATIEGGITSSEEMSRPESTEASETEKRLLRPPTPATSPTIEEQHIESQDTSMTDEAPVAESANSPVQEGILSSIGSNCKVQSTKSTNSIEAPMGLDEHVDAQNIEAPEVPDSNSLAMAYDHDDTDMLRNFLTRVKANKAAKNPPKRKRSLPHSPLRIPLGDLDNNVSPSPLQLEKGNGLLSAAEPSPSKRKKKPSPLAQCESEPEPRRSSRTRPPVKEPPPGAPSLIPVRRLGQDPDTTVTLKRNEDKELAALTRVNTRKNKGNALTALEVLAKKSEEKEDPVMRQRLLKEVFDEKVERERGRQDKEEKKNGGRGRKSVAWAEELAQFQTVLTKKSGKLGEGNEDKENEKPAAAVAVVVVSVVPSAEDKKQQQQQGGGGAVRVGVRSKAALGMALNGTPAPKRKMRGRV